MNPSYRLGKDTATVSSSKDGDGVGDGFLGDNDDEDGIDVISGDSVGVELMGKQELWRRKRTIPSVGLLICRRSAWWFWHLPCFCICILGMM